jgi:serine protease Do
MFRVITLLFIASFAVAADTPQNPREKKVREDKAKVEADGFWIYNDLPKAMAAAKQEGKPLVVALRCIPCEECVKLDDDLVDTDKSIRPLLEKFVRVRLVSTNGLDLTTFQYDTDQSFAVFFLNADGTIYGRFGTRSHRTNWVGDVSLAGLTEALKGALDLHAGYPKNKESLAAKRGPAPLYPAPEKFPTLSKYKSEIDYKGSVVPSCIHCHQIGDAIRSEYRAKKEPLPEDVLFPYPHPKSQGLILDPKAKATVKEVTKGSTAEKAGFKAGDQIEDLGGQQLLSIADVQWVLHNTPAKGGKLLSVMRREGKPLTIEWTLPDGWRQADDISWRSSSWGLRRMVTGGMKLDAVEGDRPAGVPKTGMALKAAHVGQFGPHAAAKAAGFLKDDVIVSFDSKSDLLRETDLFAHAMRTKKPGEKVAVTVVRGGKTLKFTLSMQE